MNAATPITIGKELTVERLGFGAMRLCGPGIWGWPADRENALRVLRRAVELGVNFIDTADSYGPHVNEEQIAQALHPYPADLGDCNQRRPDAQRTGEVEALRPPRALGRGVRRKLAALAARSHRSLSVARNRSGSSARRAGRHAAQAARCGEDSPRRALERRPRAAAARGTHRRDRFGAEQLQRQQSGERTGARVLRSEGHRVHPVLSARRRRPRDASSRAGADRASRTMRRFGRSA